MLQFGGWGGLMITSFMAMLLFVPGPLAITANMIFILLGVLISHVYRAYVKKRDWKALKVPKLIPRVLLASLVQGTILGVLSLLVIIAVFVAVAKTKPDFLQEIVGTPSIEGIDTEVQQKINEATLAQFTPSKIIISILSFVISFAIYFISWSALYFAYQYLQRTREMEIEKWKLSASVKYAELSALKAQINPHFIFNSLNNIRSLVIENAERARDSITHLSDLLRFSIQFDQFEKVSLDKEIAVARDYLNLEAIQLEERLRYRFNVSQEANSVEVPPMIVQTLVENAIKHSINELPEGGEIIVEYKLDQNFLVIYVKNTGQLKLKSDQHGRRGIGINNSKERLRLLYGDKANLTVENMNEEMVCATIRIPLEQKER